MKHPAEKHPNRVRLSQDHVSCRNCDREFSGKYCPDCGQPAKTHRLDLHSVWHDIQHGLLHIDKGILYTLSQLFTKPGITIREYIEGKRVRHFKPVSLVIILATIYALISHFLKIGIVEDTGSSLKSGFSGLNLSFSGDKTEMMKIKEFIEDHFAVLQFMLLPFYAAASRLAFRKCGYNYVEHVVINSFIRGQAIVIAILFIPFVFWGWLSKDDSAMFTGLITSACLFWIFIQLFRSRPKKWVVKRTILTIFYFGVIEAVVAGTAVGLLHLLM